ncbi:MAG: hypothetical protein ACOC47_04425 [Alkalispirochaetaceae bacterium]
MSFGRLLKEALALGRKFPLVYLPVLVVSLLAGLITALFMGGFGAMPPGMGPAMGTGYAETVLANIWLHLLSAVVAGILIIAGHAVTVLMVGQVLQLGGTSLAKGVEQARLRLVQLLIAGVITALLVGIGFVFFLLPGLIVGFFLLFTFVAVALEQYSAVGGIKKSFLVVKQRLGDSFVFFLLLIALGVLFALVNRIVLFIPILGGLLSLILAGIYSGYVSTLVVLGYRELNPGGLAEPTEKGGPPPRRKGPTKGGDTAPGAGKPTDVAGDAPREAEEPEEGEEKAKD